MVLRLHQSKWSPHKATYANDHGQVLYKVDTPRTLRNQVSTIYRVIPNSSSSSNGEPSTSAASTSVYVSLPAVRYDDAQEEVELQMLRQRSQKTIDLFTEDQDEQNGAWADFDSDKGSRKDLKIGDSASELDVDMQDRFEVMARIEWSLFGSSVFDWGDAKTRTNDFFKRSGFYAFGPGKKWTGPDGRSYVWQLRMWTPVLVLDDGTKEPPLVAAFHRAPFLHPFEKEWLEIYPEGEKIIDAILVTYIYVERVRKNRERAARHNGGGGS